MSNTYLPNTKDWTMISLSANPKAGYIEKVSTGGTPSTSKEDYWDGGILWLTPKEITGLSPRLYVSETERRITDLGSKSSSAKIHPPGCVMLSKRAPVGLVAINTTYMSTNQGFLTFKCGDNLRPAYLAYWLRTNKKYLDAFSNGSTYQELYISDLSYIKMAVPTLYEQDKILEIIRGIEMMLSIHGSRDLFESNLDMILKAQNLYSNHSFIREKIYPLLLSGSLDVENIGEFQ